MLDIVTSYHRIQFQGKRMIQTQENGQKPLFGPDLGKNPGKIQKEEHLSKRAVFGQRVFYTSES